MKIIILSFLFVVFVVSTYAQPTSPSGKSLVTSEAGSTKTGAIEDGIFNSKRFGISIEIPKTLTIISTAEFKVLNDAGLELIKSEGGKGKGIEEAERRAQSLLVIAAKPLGTPLNSALEIAAAFQQSGVTAKMVLTKNVELFKGSAYTLKRSLGELQVGYNIFSSADFEVQISGIKFYQRMYILMHKGYSIVIVNTYHNEEQRLEMEAVLAKAIFIK